MTDIGVGDWVECVEVEVENTSGGEAAFRLGGIYQVDAVGVYEGIPWLTCAGMPTPIETGYDADGWKASAFRPIYRPKHNWADKFAHVRFDGTLVNEGGSVPVANVVPSYTGYDGQFTLSEYELAKFRLNFPGF